MSRLQVADLPCREATLLEEIRDLSKYDVPENVIERISKKVNECGEWEKRRIEDRDRAIHDLQESNRNKDAIIDAVGGYLAIQSMRCREV